MAAAKRKSKRAEPATAPVEVVHVPTRSFKNYRRIRMEKQVSAAQKKSIKQSTTEKKKSHMRNASRKHSTPCPAADASASEPDSARGEASDSEANTDSDIPRARGRKRALVSDSDDGGNESGTEQDSTHQRPRKQGRQEHQIVVGQPVPLERWPVEPAAPTVPSESSAPTGRDKTPPPPPPAGSAPSDVTCTPYKHIPDPGKKEETLERLYTPPSKKVVKKLKWPLKCYVATERAFFTHEQADNYLRPILLELLQEPNEPAAKKNRIAREKDEVYMYDILHHVQGTASKLRNHSYKIARILVRAQYELDFRKPPNPPEDAIARQTRVGNLMREFKFAALDTDTGLGMFENPVIHELIARTFFERTAPTFNIAIDPRCASAFKSYPDGLIAFSAITILAALKEWSSGVYRPLEFKGKHNEEEFEALLHMVEDLTSGTAERAAFAKKRSDWYAAAWSRSDRPALAHMAGDLDDLILRNRAALRAQAPQNQEEEQGEGEGPGTGEDTGNEDEITANGGGLF